LLAGAIAAGSLGIATPAAAEVGASVSVFSDARFRGYSLSSGHPVAVVDISYDHRSGLYGAVTIDVGAVHSSYTHYSSRGEAKSYTEVYAGASRGFLTARVYLSPHYFGRVAKAAYGELDATVSPLRKLRLSGHVGLLVPIEYRPASNDERAQYDWRLGVAREVGAASIHVIATGGGPGRDYYGGRRHDRTTLILGVSWAL